MSINWQRFLWELTCNRNEESMKKLSSSRRDERRGFRCHGQGQFKRVDGWWGWRGFNGMATVRGGGATKMSFTTETMSIARTSTSVRTLRIFFWSCHRSCTTFGTTAKGWGIMNHEWWNQRQGWNRLSKCWNRFTGQGLILGTIRSTSSRRWIRMSSLVLHTTFQARFCFLLLNQLNPRYLIVRMDTLFVC